MFVIGRTFIKTSLETLCWHRTATLKEVQRLMSDPQTGWKWALLIRLPYIPYPQMSYALSAVRTAYLTRLLPYTLQHIGNRELKLFPGSVDRYQLCPLHDYQCSWQHAGDLRVRVSGRRNQKSEGLFEWKRRLRAGLDDVAAGRRGFQRCDVHGVGPGRKAKSQRTCTAVHQLS